MAPPGAQPAPDRPPAGPPRTNYATAMGVLLLRSGIYLLLALGIGVLLARRFTRPLQALAEGAKAYQARDFSHTIPVQGDGEFAEVAAAMHDMAGKVSQHIEGLEDDARRRRQLLADVAHELRGPVMTMRTMAGALAEGLAVEPERHERAVQSLVRTSDRMLHLVTDLLELAKLDLRELPLHPQPVDLRELTEHALHAHGAAAAEAGITLSPAPAGPPLLAQADPDRLSQVLDNLLDNAISYAGRGATVHVELDPGVRLRVVDTGQGIAAQHLPYLFDPFYRVDTVRNTRERHSGLGLRITRALVEAQGGTLTLTSRPGEGTTVEVTLREAK
jgi:two-component system sensor histidine kinase BaeS